MALALLVVALVATGILLLNRPGDISAGPVEVGGVGTANAQPIEVGVDYSFGYMLWNYGKKPATVERVRVLGVTGPIEVLDVWARQHPSGPKPHTFMFLFGFPPPEYPSKPLAEENTVPVPTLSDTGSAYEGLQLVVGVRSTGAGIGRIQGIEVTYRIGERRFRNSSNGRGFLCAPAAEYRADGPKFHECGNIDEDTWDDKFVDVRVLPDKRK
ncbi:MAG TPA: hypothetical protein VFS16_05895 [Acidimicrobiia bacterium]|nr:hypothetical protein [Acidimicrobiia bacterium]